MGMVEGMGVLPLELTSHWGTEERLWWSRWGIYIQTFHAAMVEEVARKGGGGGGVGGGGLRVHLVMKLTLRNVWWSRWGIHKHFRVHCCGWEGGRCVWVSCELTSHWLTKEHPWWSRKGVYKHFMVHCLWVKRVCAHGCSQCSTFLFTLAGIEIRFHPFNSASALGSVQDQGSEAGEATGC